MIVPGSGGFGPPASATARQSAATCSTATSPPPPPKKTTASPTRKRSARPPHRRTPERAGGQRMNYIPNSIEARDIASLVHMQTNLRTAPDGRPAGHHARRRLPRVRQHRARLHRGGRRPVVRLARLRLRAARQGRLRADARARLLPPVSPPLQRARHRAGREAAGDRAGADGARHLPVLGLGGQRHRHQARLVLLERGRPAAAHQDHRPPVRPITATPARPSACPASPTCTPASICRSRRSSTPSSRTTTAATRPARARSSSPRAWPTRWRR